MLKPYNTRIPEVKPVKIKKYALELICAKCGNLECNPINDQYRCGSIFQRGVAVIPRKSCCNGEFWIPLDQHDPTPEEMANTVEFDGYVGDISIKSAQIIDYDNTWAQIKLQIGKYKITTDEDVVKAIYKCFNHEIPYRIETEKVCVYAGRAGKKVYYTLRLRNSLRNGQTSWHSYDMTPEQVKSFCELTEAYMDYYALESIEELGV
jgi:hypothetical protein